MRAAVSPLFLKNFLPVDKKLKSVSYTLLIKGKESIFMELKMKNLTKRYGDKAAVDRLNVSLTKGVYGLLGANRGQDDMDAVNLRCSETHIGKNPV